jgi:hypothetical protein
MATGPKPRHVAHTHGVGKMAQHGTSQTTHVATLARRALIELTMTVERAQSGLRGTAGTVKKNRGGGGNLTGADRTALVRTQCNAEDPFYRCAPHKAHA